MQNHEVLISSDMVDPYSRNDFWREATRPYGETQLANTSNEKLLQGTIRTRVTGNLMIAATTFNAQQYKRTRQHILQNEFDGIVLQVITGGTLRGALGSRNVFANCGDICIVDLSKTFEIVAEAGSRLTFVIPRKVIESALGNRDIHGLVLKAAQPMTQLLLNYLYGLNDLSPKLTQPELSLATQALATLLSTNFTGAISESPDTVSIMEQALRERVLQFIDANLKNSELGTEMIMKQFRVSRAHLYRAFEADGGIAKIIRNKRIDFAYTELMNPQISAQSINQLSYQCGFSNIGQFLRAFRARFDMTPTEAKNQGLLMPQFDGVLRLQDYFSSTASAW